MYNSHMPPKKLVYFGSPSFSAWILESIITLPPVQVAGVVQCPSIGPFEGRAVVDHVPSRRLHRFGIGDDRPAHDDVIRPGADRLGGGEGFYAGRGGKVFCVAGGGETVEALKMTKTTSHINWLSTGGGAMLEYIEKGTLPGIEALKR